jgi:uncharacterized integral membrane protein
MVFPSENRPLTPAEDAPPPLPPELAGTLAGLEGAGEAPARRRPAKAPKARTGAVWAGVVGLLLLLLLVAQNTGDVRLSFLWWDGRIPGVLALLIAAACGALIATAVASVRTVKRRRR